VVYPLSGFPDEGNYLTVMASKKMSNRKINLREIENKEHEFWKLRGKVLRCHLNFNAVAKAHDACKIVMAEGGVTRELNVLLGMSMRLSEALAKTIKTFERMWNVVHKLKDIKPEWNLKPLVIDVLKEMDDLYCYFINQRGDYPFTLKPDDVKWGKIVNSPFGKKRKAEVDIVKLQAEEDKQILREELEYLTPKPVVAIPEAKAEVADMAIVNSKLACLEPMPEESELTTEEQEEELPATQRIEDLESSGVDE